MISPDYKDTRANRLEILRRYYNLSEAVLSDITEVPYSDARKQLCRSQGLDPYIVRTMVDYDRYFEASQVEKQLRHHREDIKGLRMLDFGCLVADYALYFARRGASVAIYDFDVPIEFARFRFMEENLSVEALTAPTPLPHLMESRQLVVFGEVLEHLDDPLAVLQACITCDVKYIFTSCYPFGDEEYFSLPGHSRLAQQQQVSTILLLKEHFFETVTHAKARFWTRKE